MEINSFVMPSVVLLYIIFPVTIAHELGHYLVARYYRYKPKLHLFSRKALNKGILASVDMNFTNVKNYSKRRAICISIAGLLELMLIIPLFLVNWYFTLAFVCFTLCYNVYEVYDGIKQFTRVTEIMWFVETGYTSASKGID